MRENQNPGQPPRSKPTEPWRVERMVQPVAGHLGEESRFSPWLVVAAVAAAVVVGALLLLFTQNPGPAPAPAPAASGSQPTATRRVTVIRITATPPPTATPTLVPTPVVIKYTVKKGDTLSTIARQFKVSVEAIRAANNLSDDTIRAGDVLNIPHGTPTPAALRGPDDPAPPGPTGPPTNTPVVLRTPTLIAYATAAATPLSTTPTPTQGVVTYVVRSGDTLLGIAGIYSTTVQSIMDLSKLTGPSLRVGQVLTVPLGIWIPSPTPTVFSTPSLTPTPQFAYAAPDLLFPTDGADFAHDTSVTLQWLSLGIRADEYYVVHLTYLQDGVEVNLPGYTVKYDEGTYLTLPSSPAGARAAQFFWYVVVVRANGCESSAPPSDEPCAVSPLSETRSFNWR